MIRVARKILYAEGIRKRIEWRREEYHFLFCVIETIKSFSFDILNSRIILKDFSIKWIYLLYVTVKIWENQG